MTDTNRPPFRLAAVVLTVLLVGCGGDGDDVDTAANDGTGTAETGAATDDDNDDNDDGDGDGADDDGAEASEPGGDLCRLVTRDEAEAIVGRPLDDGRASETDGPSGTVGSCVYMIAEGGTATTIVNVAVVGTTLTREQFDAELAGDAPDAESVTGVGEVALLVQPGVLMVFDGGVALSVQILVDGQGAATDVLVDVAAKALDRL